MCDVSPRRIWVLQKMSYKLKVDIIILFLFLADVRDLSIVIEKAENKFTNVDAGK